jgi:hypothetical protein
MECSGRLQVGVYRWSVKIDGSSEDPQPVASKELPSLAAQMAADSGTRRAEKSHQEPRSACSGLHYSCNDLVH